MPFDHLLLTAANPRQARAYYGQLQLRRRAGLLSEHTQIHVVSDPGGRRIGSGGALLVALHKLLGCWSGAKSIAAALSGKRILLLQGGGDSRRLPAYAAQGKLFVPLPGRLAAGQPATIFDLFLEQLSALSLPVEGCLLVGSGDVLFDWSPANMDLASAAVTGVGFRGDSAQAARHGVFVPDREGRVRNFLQKPSVESLRQHRAFDQAGRFLIDSGLWSFRPQAVETLCQAAGLHWRQNRPVVAAGLLADLEAAQSYLDLYYEIAMALASDVTPEAYQARMLSLPRNASARQQQHLRRLYRGIHGQSFYARTVPGTFLHLGTTRELLANLTEGTGRFGLPAPMEPRQAVYHSALGKTQPICPERAVVIEGCHLRGKLHLEGGNLVNGLPAELTRPVHLPVNVSLFMVPTGRQDWVAVLYGTDDDLGQAADNPNSSFLNMPLPVFLKRHGLDSKWLWPAGERTMYTAKLWPCGRPNQVLKLIEWMTEDQTPTMAVAAWRWQPRLSLAELALKVNHQRLKAQRDQINHFNLLQRPLAQLAMAADFDAAAAVGQICNHQEATACLTRLAIELADVQDPGLRARARALAQMLGQRVKRLPGTQAEHRRFQVNLRALAHGEVTTAAQGEIRKQVALAAPTPQGIIKAVLDVGDMVETLAPARIDLAGGWSDTPPICLDRGGCVVNAAITVNGQHPIRAVVRLNDRFLITLTSLDLKQRLALEHIEELGNFADPSDWASLPKACLVATGLIGHLRQGPLPPLLRRFGGGIDVVLYSALPRGSGLGTSSILAAALLNCLARLIGEEPSTQKLGSRTLLVEQMLTTGGGWQDTIGGLHPGVKLIHTSPGLDQSAKIEPLPFPKAWRPRLLLYYTGQPRLAKNILQQIVWKYLTRDRQVLRIIDQLKDQAGRLRNTIVAEDFAGFAAGIRSYWELKKSLYAKSTTPQLDNLFRRLQTHCLGYTLAGAGGGGFALLAAKDEKAIAQIRSTLLRCPAGRDAGFFNWDIDDDGIVTILPPQKTTLKCQETSFIGFE